MLIKKLVDEVKLECRSEFLDKYAGMIETRAYAIQDCSFTTYSIYEILRDTCISTNVEDVFYNYMNDGKPRPIFRQQEDAELINRVTYWLDTGNVSVKVYGRKISSKNIVFGLDLDKAGRRHSRLGGRLGNYVSDLFNDVAEELSTSKNQLNVFYRYLGFSYTLLLLDCVFMKVMYPEDFRWNNVQDPVYLHLGKEINMIKLDSGLRQGMEGLC